VLLGTETYDPAVHGPSVPGYELLREQTAEDERQRAANAESEWQMREEMEALAQEKGLDVRFLHVRMSLGRQRLFAWYASAARHCDLSDIAREAGRRHGVQVMARQLGPRDEVGMMGALGPCGRPCCCATWQARYPSGLTADRVRGMDVASAQPNGMCGRYKCCLAFEE
jgi:cell fate regulator YaaT (PSP1 superfamily)